MTKKIKLPFHELENQFPTIISEEELKSILGGSYGYEPDSWSSNGTEGFLNNVSDMMYNGMFNFSGMGSDYSNEFSTSAFFNAGGSGGSGSAAGGIGGSGSGAPSWSMPSLYNGGGTGANSFNFNTPSTNNNLFTFGSAVTSGSNQSPAPLVGNFQGFTTSLVATGPSGFNPSLTFTKSDGSKLTISFKPGSGSSSGTLTIKASF
jgi:hypothetical protein